MRRKDPLDYPLPLTFDNFVNLANALSYPMESTSIEELQDELYAEKVGNAWLFGRDRKDLQERIAFMKDFVTNAASPILHRGRFFKNVIIRWNLAQRLAAENWSFLPKVIAFVDLTMVNSIVSYAANRGSLAILPLSSGSFGYLAVTSMDYFNSLIEYVGAEISKGSIILDSLPRFPPHVPRAYIADPKQSDWRSGLLMHMQSLGLVRQTGRSYREV